MAFKKKDMLNKNDGTIGIHIGREENNRKDDNKTIGNRTMMSMVVIGIALVNIIKDGIIKISSNSKCNIGINKIRNSKLCGNNMKTMVNVLDNILMIILMFKWFNNVLDLGTLDGKFDNEEIINDDEKIMKIMLILLLYWSDYVINLDSKNGNDEDRYGDNDQVNVDDEQVDNADNKVKDVDYVILNTIHIFDLQLYETKNININKNNININEHYNTIPRSTINIQIKSNQNIIQCGFINNNSIVIATENEYLYRYQINLNNNKAKLLSEH